MRAYDEEAGAEFGLTDLAEESDDDDAHHRANGSAKGHSKSYNETIELQNQRSNR